ncbi:pectin esterase [Bacteroides sp. 214]|nr:pectinesterase family protein [Bacteroides sp. 214]NDW13644.1 pectin esterase [Bacteroides sp. 214]
MLFLFACKNQTSQQPTYHATVAQDGSGAYTTVQSAIDAAPDSLTSPWRIFVKNGSYQEQVIVPEHKPFIHLIGQDKEETIIHYALNVGGKPAEDETPEGKRFWEYSVHNPDGKVYKMEGSVVTINASDFYSENISYINDFGKEFQSGPQALAMKSLGDRIAFYNCKFISFQDTWMTTRTDEHRHYAKDCYIEGAVDYIYASGDALFEHCTLYNVRRGSVIVAPCQKEDAKYGYVFRDCFVDGNEEAADGNIKLGRPWHHSPKAVFINTTMLVPIAEEGWTNMGTIPGLFAEYNSRDKEGNILDLSQRKTEYQGRDKGKEFGTSRATITKEEAENYTYEHIIKATDGWDPRRFMP